MSFNTAARDIRQELTDAESKETVWRDGEGALTEEAGADVAVGLEHGDKGGDLLFQVLAV